MTTGIFSCKNGDTVSNKSDGISACIGVSTVSSAANSSDTILSISLVPVAECSKVCSAVCNSSAVQLRYCPSVYSSIRASSSSSTGSSCSNRTLFCAASFSCIPYTASSSASQCALSAARLRAAVRHSSASPNDSMVQLPLSFFQLCQIRSASCSCASVSISSCCSVSVSLVHCASVNISSVEKYFFR